MSTFREVELRKAADEEFERKREAIAAEQKVRLDNLVQTLEQEAKRTHEEELAKAQKQLEEQMTREMDEYKERERAKYEQDRSAVEEEIQKNIKLSHEERQAKLAAMKKVATRRVISGRVEELGLSPSDHLGVRVKSVGPLPGKFET